MAKSEKRDQSGEKLSEFSPESTEGASDVVQFDPDTPQGSAGGGLEVQEMDDSVDTIPSNQAWFTAQEELEQQLGLTEAFAASLIEESADYTGSAGQIVGTGIGFRTQGDTVTPDVVLKVFVTEKVSGERASRYEAVPEEIGGLQVIIEEVGEIVPQSYNRRYTRPVRCGVSIGHPGVSAGTLGALVVLNNNRLALLSNNHVIADENNARIGDAILQPGRVDGGVSPQDRIAILENFVRINFLGPNLVDAAVAWTSFSSVDPRHVTYRVNPTPVAPRLGMTVKKNGRTTQATLGMISDINVTIRVSFSGGVAEFRNQIGIRGTGMVFSRGGDSGSLIVTANTNQPVGLLFAGRTDNTITFANPIGAVMAGLGIRRFV